MHNNTVEADFPVEKYYHRSLAVSAFCLIFPRFTRSSSQLDAYFSGQVSHARWLALTKGSAVAFSGRLFRL